MNLLFIPFRSQLYCWQVAPQQCLLPLQADADNLNNKI